MISCSNADVEENEHAKYIIDVYDISSESVNIYEYFTTKMAFIHTAKPCANFYKEIEILKCNYLGIALSITEPSMDYQYTISCTDELGNIYKSAEGSIADVHDCTNISESLEKLKRLIAEVDDEDYMRLVFYVEDMIKYNYVPIYNKHNNLNGMILYILFSNDEISSSRLKETFYTITYEDVSIRKELDILRAINSVYSVLEWERVPKDTVYISDSIFVSRKTRMGL